MVLTKGQKILLIATAAVILIAGIVIGTQVYQQRMERYQACAEIFLQVSLFHNDEQAAMLRGEGEYGPTYQKIKNSSSFEKKLAETMSEIIETPSDVLRMTQDQQSAIVNGVALLEQEGIHSEQLATILNNYITAKKEEAFGQDASANQAVSNLDRMIKAVGSDYYRIDILTEDEVVSFYRDAVENAMAQDDLVAVSKNLNIIIEDGRMEQCFPDTAALVDEIMEKCAVYALTSGTGAYYDGQQNTTSSSSSSLGASGMPAIGSTSRSSSQSYCGDFKYATSSTSSHVDGLLDQASKDKYNTSSSSSSLYFRDLDIQGSFYGADLVWAVDTGAQYILCAENDQADGSNEVGMDGILMLGSQNLFVWDNYNPTEYHPAANSGSDTTTQAGSNSGSSVGTPCSMLSGDFSAQFETAKARYAETYSPTATIENAAALMQQGEYEKALQTLRLYTQDETCQNYIFQIAVAQMQDGQADQALQTVSLLPEYASLRNYDMQKIEENLVDDYEADYKYRDEYYQVFCRFMLDTANPLTGDQIRAALVPGSWDENIDNTLSLQADGTGRRGSYMNTSEITWSIDGNQLTLRYNKGGSGTAYPVYKLFDGVYLLGDKDRYILLSEK